MKKIITKKIEIFLKIKILLVIIFFIFNFFIFINADNKLKNSISRSFQGIELGIQKSEFESIIKEKNMIIQGELEVYFNEPDKNVIAVSYPPYFRKILFLFYKEKLSMMVFYFNPDLITVYEEYLRLYQKYGEPIVNQKQFIWEDNNTLLILEKDPFIVKLIDKEFLKQLENENKQLENILQQTLDQSLDTL